MIENTFKERMRRRIVDGYIQAGAPRDCAQEIADLTLYACQQAGEALDRVATTASSPAVFSAVLVNATQIAAAMFTAKSEALVQAAVDIGLDKGGFDVGDVSQ